MRAYNKTEILVFASYYLPGFKAGGPIRSIGNMLEYLGNEYTFKIITRDRDLGDDSQYEDVKSNVWQKKYNSSIFYISPEKLNFRYLYFLIKNNPHDYLYLNSFFDPITFKLLVVTKFIPSYSSSIILAPRGEFSSGALGLNTLKKKIYTFITLTFGLYKNVIFQASSKFEKDDIINNSPFKNNKIKIALDLPSKIESSKFQKIKSFNDDILRIVFLSRISPMKNLKYALNILKKIKRDVIFDIYGPIEDPNYWFECSKVFQDIPSNVKIEYMGSVAAENVKDIFLNYDLFFLPSKGENYGHVIAEALSVGTPVLISNNTPWKNLENDYLGWEIDLNEPNLFVSVIEEFKPNIEFWKRSTVHKNALKRILNPSDIKDNISLFKN
jgi:glycosyltransferase involved in cell wall biosynthesis